MNHSDKMVNIWKKRKEGLLPMPNFQKLTMCKKNLHELSGDNVGWHIRTTGRKDRYCILCERVKHNESYYRHRDRRKQAVKIYAKGFVANRKLRVLELLGNRCQCCGESITELLTVDHIGGWGKQHRKESKKNLYDQILHGEIPINSVRTMCMNCNWAERRGEPCPHVQLREEQLGQLTCEVYP